MTDDWIAFLKHEEGLRLDPYLDQVGLPTIGYGHRIPSMRTPRILADHAEALLREDAAKAERQALALCPHLTGRRLDAVADLCYNIGPNALRGSGTIAAFNRGDWQEAAARFVKWDKAHQADGTLVALPVLTQRRKALVPWILEG